MLLAGAMTATHALPSYAVDPILEGNAIAVYDPETDEVQTLTVADAGTTTVVRDSYTVVAPPPPPPPPKPKPPASVSTYASASQLTYTNDGSAAIQWPFASTAPITSMFGPRRAPCGACSSYHRGLDFAPGNGTPIQAMADGIVRQVVMSDSGLGVHVIIDHQIDGTRVSSLYAHMQFNSVPLTAGQTVVAGETVGRVGNTGASTGPHLHFEIQIGGTQIDPYGWLTAHAN